LIAQYKISNFIFHGTADNPGAFVSRTNVRAVSSTGSGIANIDGICRKFAMKRPAIAGFCTAK
jgi:hypothetical protein